MLWSGPSLLEDMLFFPNSVTSPGDSLLILGRDSISPKKRTWKNSAQAAAKHAFGKSIAFVHSHHRGSDGERVEGYLKHWIPKDRSAPHHWALNKEGKRKILIPSHTTRASLGSHWSISLLSWKTVLPTMKTTATTLGHPVTFICADFWLLFAWHGFSWAMLTLKTKCKEPCVSEWGPIHHKGFPS